MTPLTYGVYRCSLISDSDISNAGGCLSAFYSPVIGTISAKFPSLQIRTLDTDDVSDLILYGHQTTLGDDFSFYIPGPILQIFIK